MRSLFLFITGCCMLFALIGMMGQLWALAVAWLILMTAAHVAGNVWGMRLRNAHLAKPHDPVSEVRWRTPSPHIIPCAVATRLRERASLGWARVVVSTLLALTGGLLGAGALWIVGWGRMDYGSLAIGGVSAAIIGGFLGFLASSFLEVSLRAWFEALQGDQRAASGRQGESPFLSNPRIPSD
jgi:hypothetical protein